MVKSTSTLLDAIVVQKIKEVAEQKRKVSFEELKQRTSKIKKRVAPSFLQALQQPSCGDIAIIAEIKRSSPSAGTITDILSPQSLAREYEQGGADAISVLTDKKFFRGSLADLQEVCNSVSLPIVRKDFIIDEYQIYEAHAAGADAVLLIAALLSQQNIQTFLDLAHPLDMACLVEVHTQEELKKVLKTSAQIIGINARNLKTFEVDLGVIEHIAPQIPREKMIVAESGIETRHDIERVIKAGCQAALVGTALLRQRSPRRKIRELKNMK